MLDTGGDYYEGYNIPGPDPSKSEFQIEFQRFRFQINLIGEGVTIAREERTTGNLLIVVFLHSTEVMARCKVLVARVFFAAAVILHSAPLSSERSLLGLCCCASRERSIAEAGRGGPTRDWQHLKCIKQ